MSVDVRRPELNRGGEVLRVERWTVLCSARERTMTFKQIETEALNLPMSSRADLARSLLQSLDDTPQDPEHERIWAEEAARRYRDLRDNPKSGIPAEEVFARLRAGVR